MLGAPVLASLYIAYDYKSLADGVCKQVTATYAKKGWFAAFLVTFLVGSDGSCVILSSVGGFGASPSGFHIQDMIRVRPRGCRNDSATGHKLNTLKRRGINSEAMRVKAVCTCVGKLLSMFAQRSLQLPNRNVGTH